MNIYQNLMYEYRTKANNSTIWEKTDGFSNQYMCALTICFLGVVPLTLKIGIHRSIGAPDHGKDFLDGLNYRDKGCLR